MEVILLENVTNLGVLGDKVSVKRGYGRNYLMPQGKAVPATADRIAEFESRRAELEKKAEDLLAAAEKRMVALSEISATIEQKAGDEGNQPQKEVADEAKRAGRKNRLALLRLGWPTVNMYVQRRRCIQVDIALRKRDDNTGSRHFAIDGLV